MKSQKISDKQLREASKNVRNAMLKSLPDIEKKGVSFSPEFENRMIPLFRKNELKKRNKVMMRNIAAVLVLILIGASIWLLANKEAVAGLTKWTLRTSENRIDINYYAASSDEELPEYTFGWLPDGYEEGEKISYNPGRISAKIEGKVGTEIYLEYQFIREGIDLSVFGKELKTETVTINKQKALLLYEKEPDTANVLTWPDGNIYFMINSKLPKDVLIKIAENVAKK